MRSQITLNTRGRGLHEVTDMVRDEVRRSGVHEGLCCVYLRHTSASLVIQENADPSAARDLEAWFNRAAPDGDPSHTHTAEGPDDMPSHIRAAITRTSETFIVADGDIVRGTWQGLFLFEHRHAPHVRKLDLMITEG
ncbi:MAG: YjbQ family protein [Planctomycetes bacterium]|jgi:secondary thiamine-phosphate synthase enzyme|nr:YjbQ family protein [Planctomycetota bacterium]